MKIIRLFGNVIKLSSVSLPVPIISGNLSKAGLLHPSGFDKLTLTAFINC